MKKLIEEFGLNKVINFPIQGSGDETRSFIHINDVVDGTLNLMVEANPGSSWHLSTNESISIRDLIQRICNLCNVEFNKIVNVTLTLKPTHAKVYNMIYKIC